MPNDPEFQAAVSELLKTPEFANHPLNRRGGGTALDTPEAVATLQLQNSAPARQRFAGEPAKWQASMGPSAQAILASNAGVKNFDDLVKPLPGGGFDYSRVKPMRTSDEFMANPEFASRMRTQPGEVSGFYEAVTGRGMGDDLKLRIKEENDRTSDIQNTLRRSFMEGKMYADPDTGIILSQRTTEVPDPTNPLGGTKLDRRWIAAPADLQNQWQQHAPRILGRPAKMGPTAVGLKALEKEYPEASQHFYNSIMMHMEGGTQLPDAVRVAAEEVRQKVFQIRESRAQNVHDVNKLKVAEADKLALAQGKPTSKKAQEARILERWKRENPPGPIVPGPGAFDDILQQSSGWPSGM